ncbi:hypothetical protein TcCL_Unassigned04889 [Trypanosoma cruzi]|nr:hypothetical protein TcCL_Unassigned04889 [Trypanosoma cruzi]
MPSLGAHDTSTGTITASASPETRPGLPAAAHTRTSSRSTRAQGPARRRTVTIAVIIARSGVAGVSELIGEKEEKEWNKRERNRAQRIQRERVDNIRRGQQAKYHNSHTTRRHPPPSPAAHFHNPQEVAESPAATTQHTAKANPQPSMTRLQNLHCHPVLTGTRSPTQRSHRKKRLGLRTPSLLPALHGHGRRQQPPHAAASMHHKGSIHIHCNVHLLCVCGCVCLQKHKAIY